MGDAIALNYLLHHEDNLLLVAPGAHSVVRESVHELLVSDAPFPVYVQLRDKSFELLGSHDVDPHLLQSQLELASRAFYPQSCQSVRRSATATA